MAIKLALLKSGETVICDLKELVSGEDTKAYIFNRPFKVSIQKEILLTEDTSEITQIDREYQVLLSPWIMLSQEDDIIVNPDWLVTITEPVSSLKILYSDKVNGTNDQVSYSEE